MANTWNIQISAPFQGFAPGYFLNTYPVVGNSSMAGSMVDVDISDPVGITQGPGLADLTNGTQAGVVTTLMKHILNTPSSDGVTWGIGGNLLYKVEPTTVTSDGNYPHTIDKAAVTDELGESTIHLGDYLYYLYNHSGSAGDIGRLTIATNTFDDDWGSTVPATGASALEDAPHPSVIGNDGIIYFGNGRYVGYYDPVTDTMSADELDFWEGAEVVDVDFDNDRLVATVNFPNLGGVNGNIGAVYYWDTVSSSFDAQPNPRIKGQMGAMYIKDGVVFVWYKKANAQGYSFGQVYGNRVQLIRNYDGNIPNFGQVTEDSGFIQWVSDDKIYRWGAEDEALGAYMSQYCDGGHATVGAIAVPFDELLLASNITTSYRLAKTSGYTTTSSWKSLNFNVATSQIDEIVIHYEPTATGSRVDATLRYDRGTKSLSIGDVRHANDGTLVVKNFTPKQRVEDFSIELDWSNGSTSNPLKVRKVEVFGHRLERK